MDLSDVANKICIARSFDVGEWVYLLITPCIGSAIKLPKLSPKYCGLWLIIEKIRDFMMNCRAKTNLFRDSLR